jgi:hypothetical protein
MMLSCLSDRQRLMDHVDDGKRTIREYCGEAGFSGRGMQRYSQCQLGACAPPRPTTNSCGTCCTSLK